MGSLVGESVLVAGVLLGPHRVSWDEQGRIVSLDPCPASEAVPGSILCPGFISLQVNGVDDVDAREAKGPAWVRLSDTLLSQGVTSYCPTLVSEPLDCYPAFFKEVEQAISAQAKGACDLLGFHIEGPFLGVPGAHKPAHCIDADLEWVAQLPPSVRIMTLAPEQKNAIEATQLLRQKGVVVAVGHSKATASQVESFVDAGGNLTTHLFNAMTGVHHRNDGLALTVLTTDALYADIIVDLQHVSARAVELAFRAKPGRMILVTDSISHLSSFTRTYYLGKDEPFGMDGGAPRLRDGTLAGATVRMNEAIANCVRHCNVPLPVALLAATASPAQAMGLQDRGFLACGLRADLVLLDASFNVLETVCQGELHSRSSPPAAKRAKI